MSSAAIRRHVVVVPRAGLVRRVGTQTEPAPALRSLDRPIGVEGSPGKAEPLPSFLQQTKELLSTPGQHRKIIQEEGGSYWSDFHAMRNHGGKGWLAPTHLFRQDKALYFPNLYGRTLARNRRELVEALQGKTSLVRVYSATSGEAHVHKLGDDITGLQTIDVNVQSNLIKHAILTLFLGKVRSMIASDRHDTYFILERGWEQTLKRIGASNSYVGYAYLVDDQAKIRWASSGELEQEERESFTRLATRLVSR